MKCISCGATDNDGVDMLEITKEMPFRDSYADTEGLKKKRYICEECLCDKHSAIRYWIIDFAKKKYEASRLETDIYISSEFCNVSVVEFAENRMSIEDAGELSAKAEHKIGGPRTFFNKLKREFRLSKNELEILLLVGFGNMNLVEVVEYLEKPFEYVERVYCSAEDAYFRHVRRLVKEMKEKKNVGKFKKDGSN